MTERGLWNIEQLELDYRIRELCKSAEATESEGIKASKFPIEGGASYYPNRFLEDEFEQEWRWQIARMFDYFADTPLLGSKTEGSITVFKKDKLWLAQVEIKSVVCPRNPSTDIHVIPAKALSPNLHIIVDCNPGSGFGHIYTRDPEGSSWSFHVGKPIQAPTKTPVKELVTQGVLL